MPSRGRIFIVEDQPDLAEILEQQVTMLGFDHCGSAACVEEALEGIRSQKPDLVLVDLMLRERMEGLVIGDFLSRTGIPFLYLTGIDDNETLRLARRTGPAGFLLKPYTESQLKTSIESVLQVH